MNLNKTRKKTNRISIRDVASKAQVSISAVSLAYNKPHQLSEKTRNRIFAIALELGYKPQGGKKIREPKTIILAIPGDISLKKFVSYFTYIVIEMLAEHSYNTVVLSYKTAEDFNIKLRSLLSKNSAEAVMVILNNQASVYKKSKLPTIYINAWNTDEHADIGMDFGMELDEISLEYCNHKKNIAFAITQSSFNDVFIKNTIEIFKKKYEQCFKNPFEPDKLLVMDETKSDLKHLEQFIDKHSPDAWIIIGDYIYHCLQNHLNVELNGFAFLDEGTFAVKRRNNNMTILERPISQIAKIGVVKILELIHTHENSPKEKSVVYSKKLI